MGGTCGRCGEVRGVRTWPVWKAPWTVPLYAADACSPAKKSLPPTLPPKAAVMVFFDVPAMIERLGAAQGKVGEWHCQRRQRWVGRRTDCNKCVRALRKRIGAPSRANHLRRSRRDRDRPREDLDQIRPDLRWRCRGRCVGDREQVRPELRPGTRCARGVLEKRGRTHLRPDGGVAHPFRRVGRRTQCKRHEHRLG